MWGVSVFNWLGSKGRGGEWLEGITSCQSSFFDAEAIADVIIVDKSGKF